MFTKIHRLSPEVLILLSFAFVILAGALLLMLPFATYAPGCADFRDTLFTAVSATCVVGLVVKDTATTWTWFGQAVILILIQIGGMGFITVTILFAMISGRKIGLFHRILMKSSISASQIGGIIRLTGFILKAVLAIEGIAAIAMMPFFIRNFGLKGIWYGVFHSVSAFCNAGFDLFGTRENYSSLTTCAFDPLINIVIMLLIIIGGIGFLTWDDVIKHKFRFRKYHLQSKLAIITSAVLIIGPTIFYFLYEFSRPTWSGLTTSQKFLASLFQAVTPRTAGFNTVDLSSMSPLSRSLMMILMLIGGSPGSTAGGLKTTTIAVLFLGMIASFAKKENIEIFGRRITDSTVRYASTIFLMYVTLFALGGFIISAADHVSLGRSFFETSSAIGTVGLTLGVTPKLGMVSRTVLVILMYLGRVGPLTLVYASHASRVQNISKMPVENINVG
ncbi:trk system potassium uptake protein TrkH [Lachnospiraceae bacterium]|nr:trk system potassium uptake protein TrkH [Lachnospiraceae bacterium]